MFRAVAALYEEVAAQTEGYSAALSSFLDRPRSEGTSILEANSLTPGQNRESPERLAHCFPIREPSGSGRLAGSIH